MNIWQNRRVLITGHTGFKGGWLSLWLAQLGARLTGYSLPAPTSPSLYQVARLSSVLSGESIADIRDLESVRSTFAACAPEVVFHLAAQPLVRASYADPLGTLSTNVMGLANVLDVARKTESVRAIVVVTSDKCYQNREWDWSYRESDHLGGHDPYSASKAAAEIVTAAWRDSFGGPAIATARAGNVIGGGDWASDRIVPDALHAFSRQETLQLRRPGAVRPWQHVLEPLQGYILLAERLLAGDKVEGAWNFGPGEEDCIPVGELCKRLASRIPESVTIEHGADASLHEAGLLKLDSARARHQLGWRPRWRLDTALDATADWHRHWLANADMHRVTLEQIAAYQNA